MSELKGLLEAALGWFLQGDGSEFSSTYLLYILLSNASPTRESENNRPAAQGAVGELRAEASNFKI